MIEIKFRTKKKRSLLIGTLPLYVCIMNKWILAEYMQEKTFVFNPKISNPKTSNPKSRPKSQFFENSIIRDYGFEILGFEIFGFEIMGCYRFKNNLFRLFNTYVLYGP